MINWRDDAHFELGGEVFELATQPTDIGAARAAALESGGFMLSKPRWMTERYDQLRSEFDRPNVVELGIYDGGSVALLALLLQPQRLVSVDLSPGPVARLDAFISEHELGATVRPYFGADQADRARLEQIIEHEFGSEPLDLVIDDASHLLAETTASFNLLFPRLRPGGLFVIEDWSWEHVQDDLFAQALMADPHFAEELASRVATNAVASRDEQPMSRLVLELVLTSAYAESIVDEVTSVRRGWTVIRRGDAQLDPADFDIAQAYGSVGRSLFRDGTLFAPGG